MSGRAWSERDIALLRLHYQTESVTDLARLLGRKVRSIYDAAAVHGIKKDVGTHRMSSTPTYKSWQKMRDRCGNPNAAQYSWYGGRGITVCERWNEFENFLADMGVRPEGTSLDRRKNDVGYEPGNCRWLPKNLQPRNQRNTIRVDGVALRDICDERGLNFNRAYGRIKRGLPLAKVLEQGDLRSSRRPRAEAA